MEKVYLYTLYIYCIFIYIIFPPGFFDGYKVKHSFETNIL